MQAISEQQTAELLKLVESGTPPDVALASLGVLRTDAQAVLADPTLADRLAVAEAKFEARLLSKVQTGTPGQVRGAMWLLNARFPDRYPSPGRPASRPASPALASPPPAAAPAGEPAPDSPEARAEIRRARIGLLRARKGGLAP